jgi:hypothetical protein
VRLDGDEMPADPDDGDAGHATGTYIATERVSRSRVTRGWAEASLLLGVSSRVGG